MKTNFLILSASFLSLCLLESCYYDNKQDLLGNNGLCDTAQVKYSTTISAFTIANCTSCHGGVAPSAGISLEGYANVKNHAGACYNAMHNGSMPKGGPKVDDCTIAKFKTWINAGSPNN